MYNPCWECFNRYGHGYSEDCKCQYGEILKLLDSYGGIETVIKILEGDSLPTVFIDKEHIDRTYAIMRAAKDGFI